MPCVTRRQAVPGWWVAAPRTTPPAPTEHTLLPTSPAAPGQVISKSAAADTGWLLLRPVPAARLVVTQEAHSPAGTGACPSAFARALGWGRTAQDTRGPECEPASLASGPWIESGRQTLRASESLDSSCSKRDAQLVAFPQAALDQAKPPICLLSTLPIRGPEKVGGGSERTQAQGLTRAPGTSYAHGPVCPAADRVCICMHECVCLHACVCVGACPCVPPGILKTELQVCGEPATSYPASPPGST